MGDAMRSSDSGRELAALGSGRPGEAGCAGLCRTGAAQTRQIALPSARDRGIDHLGLRGWPFEVGVRDRVAVRVMRGEAERAVDPGFELLGEDVLEPVGFVVDGVDVQAERLRQIELEQ